jgi:hypothetical protein
MTRPRKLPPKGSYRSVPAGVPPVSPRRGLNSQKEAAAQGERKRAKRVGVFRGILSAVRILFIAALAVAAVGGGGVAAWRAFEGTGFLSLREVEVVGNRLWDRQAVLEKSGVELGVKLPFIPARKAEAALRTLPGVADADVSRIWPSGLRIRVIEKEPVACGYSRGWRGLASDGAALPRLDSEMSDLPVIDGFASLPEVRRAELGAFLEAVRREQPALYAGFSQLAVREAAKGTRGKAGVPAELEIVLRDGSLKVLLEMGNKSLSSLEFLQALLKQQKAALDAGRTVDLRVEGYAYVR